MSNVCGKISHVCGKKSQMFACGKGGKQSIRMHSKTQSTAVYTRQDNGPARQSTDWKTVQNTTSVALDVFMLVKVHIQYLKATKASLPMFFLVCETEYTAYYRCFHTNSHVLPHIDIKFDMLFLISATARQFARQVRFYNMHGQFANFRTNYADKLFFLIPLFVAKTLIRL